MMAQVSSTLRPVCLIALVPLLLLAVPGRSGPSSAPPLPAPSEVIGGQTSVTASLACVGCIGGGITLGMMGVGWVLAAASRPGSAIAVAGCLWACRRALAH